LIRPLLGAGSHTHEYLPDARPEWGGVVCRVCGFRLPPSQVAAALAAGARFPERLDPAALIGHRVRLRRAYKGRPAVVETAILTSVEAGRNEGDLYCGFANDGTREGATFGAWGYITLRADGSGWTSLLDDLGPASAPAYDALHDNGWMVGHPGYDLLHGPAARRRS